MRNYRYTPLTLSLTLLTTAALSSTVQADNTPATSDDTEFDLQALRARGADPKLAALFRQAPRFMPGESSVALTVNGAPHGRVKVRFDKDGKLCADKAFQQQAGLVSPPGFSDTLSCFDLKSAWPQAELTLDPAQMQVDVVVPANALADQESANNHWTHGGVAGLANYDATYMGGSGSAGGTRFLQLNSEAGVNLSDWIIRSRQSFSQFNGTSTLRHQDVYAQRSFVDSKRVLQVGQIGLSNSLFGTGQVLGLQVLPETALSNSTGGAGIVEGIAVAQSVVEVRQSGVLIYTTTVPAGPFLLKGFSLLNTRTDLNVTLTSNNGTQRQFVVPASALLSSGNVAASGLSYGVGKLNQSGSSSSPLLGTTAMHWQLTPRSGLTAGILGSTPYRASGLALDMQPYNGTLISLETRLAQDAQHRDQGVSNSVSLSHNLTERLGLSLNLSQQTAGYHELSDAMQSDNTSAQDRTHRQYGGGLSWSQGTLGSFSLSWARSASFNGSNTDYLRGGWSRQFGRVYLGASLEHNTGNTLAGDSNRFYLTMNLPLGAQSLSSSLNSSGNSTRIGSRYSAHSSQDRNWSLSTEHDSQSGQTSGNGTLNMVTPVSQLSSSLGWNSGNSLSWSMNASGGAVFHHHGVTLSPYPVKDTFGIAKVGDEAGVRLDTPAGPTWTDSRGYAVLPSLGGFQHSMIQVDTRSLAKNTDINNAFQETEAARGSVSELDFSVVRTRRVLVTAKDSQGRPLPAGASVFDMKGNFVTVTGNDSTLFIPDASDTMKLEVQSSGRSLCILELLLPKKATTKGLYETATAVCRIS